MANGNQHNCERIAALTTMLAVNSARTQILVDVPNMIIDFSEIWEMDINPIAVSEGKACALDARIILDTDNVEALHFTGSPTLSKTTVELVMLTLIPN